MGDLATEPLPVSHVGHVPPAGPPLCGAISVAEDGGAVVVRLTGEIDTAVVDAQGGAATAPGRAAPDVVDASAVTFLDGRGVRLLVRLAEGASRAGHPLVLRRPTRPVRRVLQVAGVAPMFTVAG
jgi:anti-anti-sigma factor